MRWAWHVAQMGEERGMYRVLVGKPERKRPLGRPRNVAGYVKKQENILSSFMNSAQLEHTSVLYCFFCVCVCLCVGGWVRVSGSVGRGVLFVFPHYLCFQSLQVFLFLRRYHVIRALQRSSFFIYLRTPWCPVLFGVMFSSTCCSHLNLIL
jgi:hypothetical protein